MTVRGIQGWLVASAALSSLAGCNLGDALQAPPKDGPPKGGQTVSVTVAPASTTVQANGTMAFVATVTGSAETAVTWTVPGAGCGTVSATGLYTAPAAAGTCQVTATSVADPSKSATAQITVTTSTPPPVTVTVSPASGSVDSCKTLTFTATVTGATDKTVTWSVQEAAGGSIGAPSGVYAAPAAAGTYHVVATSNADVTRKGTAPVTVATRVLSVTVSPAVVNVQANGTAQLTATVTTTCGTFPATQTLRAAGAGSN